MKKIAIIIGHAKDSPGAASAYGIKPEYFFNTKVASYLNDIADIYHYDTYKFGYGSMVKRLFKKINQKKYAITIELHYNAATPAANGTEVLYYFRNLKGKKYAEKLSSMISQEFQTKNRGARGRNRKQRGGYALYAGNATAILVEPFFGSNKNDASKFRGKEKEYAEVLRKFILEI